MTTERAVCNSSKKDVAESFLVYWEDEGSVTAVLSGCVDKGVVGEQTTVKQGKNEYKGKLIYEGTKEEMCRLEQLFIENKFDPLDHQLKPLDELLIIPLNKEVKRRKRKQVQKPAQTPAKEPAQKSAKEPTQKPKRKKTAHTIIKVTSHGGICPTSVASSGGDQPVTTSVQSSSDNNETVTTTVQPSATEVEQRVVSNNETSMPILPSAVTSNSDTSVHFSDDEVIVVTSKLPVPTLSPFTMGTNTPTRDGGMSPSGSSSSMNISYENEMDVRLENVEVRLSHLEYKMRCIESKATYNTTRWNIPAQSNTASGYTPSLENTSTPPPGYKPSLEYNSAPAPVYKPSSEYNSAPAPGYTPLPEYNSAAGYSPSPEYNSAAGYSPSPEYNSAAGYTPSPEYNSVPGVTPSSEYNSTPGYTPSMYNSVSAWPSSYSMGSQVTPPPFPPTLQSCEQMSSTPPTHTPSPVGAGLNMGVTGVPSSTCVDLTVSGPSQNITPPPSLVRRGPFLAAGRPNTRYLLSSAIPTNQLRNIDEVIAQHRSLVHKDTAGTLCQILAREAVFGKDVLARCTVTGNGGKTALPLREMNNLKRKIFSLFPAYHSSPEQFESVWKICIKAIEQACGRQRREMEKRGH